MPRPLHSKFSLFNPTTVTTTEHHPTRSAQVVFLLHLLPHCAHHLTVGCFVSLSNGSPVRLGLHPSLYLLMGHILAHQTRNQMPASASAAACDLHILWGSGGTMIWWHRCSTHGERSAKPLGVGWHDSSCVCVVCGVWCVVCGVWCVVCGVWCVVCGVWCVHFECFVFCGL
jgi:hypothetical protein